MVRFRSILFFLLLFKSFGSIIAEEKDQIEQFSEALLLKPLPDRKVLAHFHFESEVPPTRTHGSHHHLFPKSIYQLVQFRMHQSLLFVLGFLIIFFSQRILFDFFSFVFWLILVLYVYLNRISANLAKTIAQW